MRTLLLVILLLPFVAKGDSTSLNQKQAQEASRDAYQECISNAINGVPGCGSFNCTGAKPAFNHVKESYCIIPWDEMNCFLFGFLNRSRDEWVAVGVQKLAIVGNPAGGPSPTTCTGSMMASDKNANDLNGKEKAGDGTGASVAGAGTGPDQYGDGASAFGLQEGDLLRGMREGKKLHDLLAESPYFKGLSAEDREHLLGVVDDPAAALKDTDMNALVDENSGLQTAKAMGAGGGMDGFGDAFAGLGGDGKEKPQEHVKDFDAAGKQLEAARGPAAERARMARKFKSILDRTIFDMVRARYQKKMPDMAGIEEFLKRQARQKPVDVKTLVRGNKAAKL